MNIADIKLGSPTILAPMAGVTDWPFRILCKEQGAGLMVSEMISAKGLVYKNENTLAMLKVLPQERPIAIQLFGSEPLVMAKAAKIAEDFGADLIDVNMGCPVPKVVKNGDGSALLKNPALVYEILSRMKESISIPLTVKIRSGWDEQSINANLVAQQAERAGVDAIAVHARTRKQMYSGCADWLVIKEIVDSVKIPVIGNGDVTGEESALAIMKITGCSGVMIGRAAEGNPWIFRRINLALKGLPAAHIGVQERFNVLTRFFLLLVDYKGEKVAVKEIRRRAPAYLKGLPGSAVFRDKLNRISTVNAFKKTLQEYMEELSTRM